MNEKKTNFYYLVHYRVSMYFPTRSEHVRKLNFTEPVAYFYYAYMVSISTQVLQ